jgi:hypothetical protein
MIVPKGKFDICEVGEDWDGDIWGDEDDVV